MSPWLPYTVAALTAVVLAWGGYVVGERHGREGAWRVLERQEAGDLAICRRERDALWESAPMRDPSPEVCEAALRDYYSPMPPWPGAFD